MSEDMDASINTDSGVVFERKFIDLNLDCLIEIFNYLTLDDLANVAEAYIEVTEFKSILDTIFVKRGGKHSDISNDPNYSDTTKLRHFGNLMTSMTIDLLEGYRYFDQTLEDHIIRYCREGLKEIAVMNIHKFTMHGIQEPFPNVWSLILYGGSLGSHFGQLNKFFPKLRKLELHQLEIEDPECIEQHFPLLTHLVVNNPEKKFYENYNLDDDNKPIFTNLNLRIFFKLNPQIESLSLKHDVDDDERKYVTGDYGIKLNKEFLHYIQRRLPQLQWLDLTVMQPVECKTLHSLHLVCDTDCSVEYRVIAELVRNYSKIKLLNLSVKEGGGVDLNNFVMIGLAKDLSNLQEIEISYPAFEIALSHDVTNFMSRCKSLKRIVVGCARGELDHQLFHQIFQCNANVNNLPGRWMLKYSTKLDDGTFYSGEKIIIEREN